MPVPEFVLALRSKIGHDPLPLQGATAIVFDTQGRLLLVRRSDNSQWALITGCLEPGEQPAAGAAREVREETGVSATVERLVSVEALDLSVAANGDQVYWLNVVFRCRATNGAPRVNDDESIQVAWFDLDALPQLPEHQTRYLTHALAEDQAPWFARPVVPPTCQ
ncbi:NUDIX domain-containing protein [Micromonospora soli]|uniref:NUDIX hydrolase n=1 Tax=Micromonospora sp. NBRC 110009 TaxID=3061627 RepID=UPI00267232F5|nr:NUDIX domain-containing protein [Micromonospora sp. NBRC 110009]WKU00918.1 NUDIX domain-containing protein [Micromonospora sp. NBRC 110009]